MRLFKLTLLLAVLLLQYHLWFGKNSVQDYFSHKQEVASLSTANQSLEHRNEVLQAEIKDLRSGYEAVEEHARNELGLIKEGETFYRLISDNDSSQ